MIRFLGVICGRVWDFAGSSRGSEVWAGFGDTVEGLFVDVVDGVSGDAEAMDVDGGDADAAEQGVGTLFGDAVGGQGVDDEGDGELDGSAVFQRRQCQELGRGEVDGLEVDAVAIELVGVVEAVVEVAEGRGVNGDGAALESVGLDVATEVDLHDVLLNFPAFGRGWVRLSDAL